jgi:hypothetical protein
METEALYAYTFVNTQHHSVEWRKTLLEIKRLEFYL